jgi:hypothetical protein
MGQADGRSSRAALIVTPLRRIARLAGARATGEFVTANRAVEVHLHLLKGRVAWGTTSQDPFAFSRHLVTTFGVTTRALAQVLDACRRAHVSLGVALVDSGLLTPEQVRSALREQLRATLRSLGACRVAPSVFLRRAASYARYDAANTFALESLLDGAER